MEKDPWKEVWEAHARDTKENNQKYRLIKGKVSPESVYNIDMCGLNMHARETKENNQQYRWSKGTVSRQQEDNSVLQE